MDMKNDRDLFYIAKEGLMSPLSPDWQVLQDDNENTYYYNKKTQKQQNEHPMDQFFRAKYLEAKALRDA